MMYSFIIPAHNEAPLLPRTLESIHAAAKVLGKPGETGEPGEAYEVIVADDASTDGTGEVAKKYGARVVRVDHRQISKTRNSGAAVAAGGVLIFVDADTTISPAVLEAVREQIAAGVVGGGAAVTFDGGLPFYGRIGAPVFAFLYRKAGLAAGCFVYCTRRAFDAVGGFDETLFASEEVAFSRAVRREGKFVVLKETVRTSGRKLRTYGFWELLWILMRFVLGGGTRSLKKRDHLGLWYDPRREDTEVQR
jgi:glycosyltransferase involved in cell wall biosynthesis